MAALRRMTPATAGTIVQVGSALSYRAIPLQSAYCGAKFAIRGFTDSIRTELRHDQSRFGSRWCSSRASTRPSSTGAAPSCPTIRSRCRRSTSPRSPPRRSTGRRITAAGSCGSATAPSRRSSATSSRRAWPIGIWPDGFSGQQIKDMPVGPDRPDNLFEPVARLAATHGIFDDRAKRRSPQLWAATHRPLLAGAAWRRARRGGVAVAALTGAPRRGLGPIGVAPHVLREYALLADGERGVLVGPRGDFAWMCFPRWDSDACFAALIGGAGAYAVTPRSGSSGAATTSTELIWRSRWIDRRWRRRVPRGAGAADPAPTVRSCCAGSSRARGPRGSRSSLDLRGRVRRAARRRGCAARRRGVDAPRRRTRAWLGGGADAEPGRRAGGRPLTMELELAAGRAPRPRAGARRRGRRCRAPDPTAPGAPPRRRGQSACRSSTRPVAPRDARHAYAVLAGLTSSGGGMVAAATMSLPERAREGRNYDYRYVWIRDQCFAGQAVAKAGPLSADGRRRALRHRAPARRRRRPRAGVHGRPAVRCPTSARWTCPAIPAAATSSATGSTSSSSSTRSARRCCCSPPPPAHDHLDADGWRAAEVAAEGDRARWREPDAGIWELEPDAWTHSRLICAAGLRAIAAPPAGSEQARAVAGAGRRDRRRHRRARASHPAGHWQRSPTDARLDAALLLPAIRGAMPADDPRTLATLARGRRTSSTEDGYCYRFRPDERPLGEAEGAFLLCGFLMALAYAQQGDERPRGPLVRAQPRGVRARRPALRGVRRRPAAAARQSAAGVRARAAAPVRRHRARGNASPATRAAAARPLMTPCYEKGRNSRPFSSTCSPGGSDHRHRAVDADVGAERLEPARAHPGQ